MLSGQATVRQQEKAHHGRLCEADDFSKIIHFGFYFTVITVQNGCFVLALSRNISLLVPFKWAM